MLVHLRSLHIFKLRLCRGNRLGLAQAVQASDRFRHQIDARVTTLDGIRGEVFRVRRLGGQYGLIGVGTQIRL